MRSSSFLYLQPHTALVTYRPPQPWLGNCAGGHVTHLASSSVRFSLRDGVMSPVSTDMSMGRMVNFCMLNKARVRGIFGANFECCN